MPGKIITIIIYLSLAITNWQIFAAITLMIITLAIVKNQPQVTSEPPREVQPQEELKSYSEGILRRMANLKQYKSPEP